MPKPKRKRRRPGAPPRTADTGSSQAAPAAAPAPETPRMARRARIAATLLVVCTGLVVYSPNFARFFQRWLNEPDYTHGFLVIPFLLYCLYERRQDLPATSPGFAWGGLLLVTLAAGCRVFGGAFFIDAIEDWSILFWVGGSVWLLFGFSAFLWSAPFVAFLFFMIPLPFRLEEGLALPLQRVATKLSTWTLQALGQPALDLGNVITIGTEQMEVQRACSGLRIFMSMIAVGVAMVMLSPNRPLWHKTLLLVATIPVALIANATRIVVTGLLYQYTTGATAKAFSHDFAGIAMVLYAIAIYVALIWYIDKLFPPYTTVRLNERLAVHGE